MDFRPCYPLEKSDFLNDLLTSMTIPSRLLQVVNSLFETCYDKPGRSSVQTICRELVNRLVQLVCRLATTCLQTCTTCLQTCTTCLQTCTTCLQTCTTCLQTCTTCLQTCNNVSPAYSQNNIFQSVGSQTCNRKCREYIKLTDVIEYVRRSTLNMTNLNTAQKRKGKFRRYHFATTVTRN